MRGGPYGSVSRMRRVRVGARRPSGAGRRGCPGVRPGVSGAGGGGGDDPGPELDGVVPQVVVQNLVRARDGEVGLEASTDR